MRLIVSAPRQTTVIQPSPTREVVAVGVQGPGGPPGVNGIPGPKGDPGTAAVAVTNVLILTNLNVGELEYAQLSNSLYLKTNIGIQKIGGADDVTKLSLSTPFAYPNTLVQRDAQSSAKFNLIEVNGITLNGPVTSTSQNTSILTNVLNENIYIGAVSSRLYAPAVLVKSNKTTPLEVTNQSDVTLFKVDNLGAITANGISLTSGTITTLGSTTGNITTVNSTTVNSTSASITGTATLGGLLVNGTSSLKGTVDGLSGSTRSNLTNFVIDGNSNTIKLRTTVADLNTLGPGETALVGDKLYYMTLSGLRSFISADSVGNMQVGNVIIEGALKIDSTTTTGGLAGVETIIDAFPISEYRSAKYVVQVSFGNEHQSSEVLVIHDGTQSYLTEYGFVQTSGTLCYLETRIEGGLVKLVSIGLEDNLSYRVIRNTISV